MERTPLNSSALPDSTRSELHTAVWRRKRLSSDSLFLCRLSNSPRALEEVFRIRPRSASLKRCLRPLSV